MAFRQIGGRLRARIVARPLAVALLLMAGLPLAGCVSTPPAPHAATPRPTARSGRILPDNLQCVPYARNHSDVKIFGDAYTWWKKADGRYIRRKEPTVGSVMVLDKYSGPEHAHVAVVRRIDNTHQIRVDHANWLNAGDIYLNDAVRDVSRAQNWSKVRVFNMKTGQWGRHDYHVRGFIGPERAGEAQKPPPKSISDLIAWLSPQDLPHSRAPDTDQKN